MSITSNLQHSRGLLVLNREEDKRIGDVFILEEDFDSRDRRYQIYPP